VASTVAGKHCRAFARAEEALRTALARMKAGDLVVYFYDNYDQARAILEQYGAVPVRAVPAYQPTEEARERARA
jgi:hypothetical protein